MIANLARVATDFSPFDTDTTRRPSQTNRYTDAKSTGQWPPTGEGADHGPEGFVTSVFHAARAGGSGAGRRRFGGVRGRFISSRRSRRRAAERRVDFLVACGSAPDRTTCLASLDFDSAQFATLKADIAAGTIAYNGQAAGACVDLFRSLTSCKQTVVGDLGPRLDATCGKVFTGSLPPAAPASSAKNVRTEESAVARLVRRTVVAPGPAWQGMRRSRSAASLNPLPNQDCIGGTVCAVNATGGGSCKAPLAAGARCRHSPLRPGPTSAAAIDPVTSEGTLPRPSRTGTACDMSGNCDDKPRLLRPDHERVHQPDASAAPLGAEVCIAS